MKRCPACGRDYDDDSLRFCLDDGSDLLFGPASGDVQATKILIADELSSEGETRLLDRDSEPSQGTTKDRRIWFAVAAGVVIILAVGAFGLYRYRLADVRQPTIKSIAVLPLENLSGDPAQEFFADGMTETLIGNLSQIRSLTVTSRRSVARFKGSKESISEIAAQLGVDAVIEGSVQRADGRLKITTQLILPATNASVWSRSYESDLKDVLKLQSDVAKEIAAEVKANLTASEKDRLDSAKTIDPAAHEAYLLGNYHVGKLNEKDLALAVDYFEQATRVEPNFADAFAGLSKAWNERGIWGDMGPLKVAPQARAAAEKALQLDPGNSRAHSAYAAILLNRDGNWVQAEAEAKRAIELDPGNAEAYVTLSWILQCLGRHDEVVPNMQMAKRLDPISTQIESDFGRMLYRARKYAEAEIHLKRSIELDSKNVSAYGRLADVYIEMGRFEEAIAFSNTANEIRPNGTYRLRLAYVYARMGRSAEAVQIVREWTGDRGTMEKARVYSALGDADSAFRVLDELFDSGDALLTNAKEEPGLQPLHSDPRWKEFLRRMKFPES